MNVWLGRRCCPSFRPVPFSPFRIAWAGVRARVDSGCGRMGDDTTWRWVIPTSPSGLYTTRSI